MSSRLQREQARRRRARRPVVIAQCGDAAGVLTGLVQMVWYRKLWWMAPFLIGLVLLAALIFLMEVTPVGPLLYPIF